MFELVSHLSWLLLNIKHSNIITLSQFLITHCILPVASYTLHFTYSSLHTAPCKFLLTYYILHIASYTLHLTHWILHIVFYILHLTHCTLHGASYTLHISPKISVSDIFENLFKKSLKRKLKNLPKHYKKSLKYRNLSIAENML